MTMTPEDAAYWPDLANARQPAREARSPIFVPANLLRENRTWRIGGHDPLKGFCRY